VRSLSRKKKNFTHGQKFQGSTSSFLWRKLSNMVCQNEVLSRSEWFVGCCDVWNPAATRRSNLAQIKNYNDEAIRRSKAMTCIHSIVSNVVFTRIMPVKQLKKLGTLFKRRFKRMKELGRCKFSILKKNLRCWEWRRPRPSKNILIGSSQWSIRSNFYVKIYLIEGS